MYCNNCMSQIPNVCVYCPICGAAVSEQNLEHQLPCGTRLNKGDYVSVVVSKGEKEVSVVQQSSAVSKTTTEQHTTSGDPDTDDLYGVGASVRYITGDDIAWMTKEQVRMTINEIYAKHGCDFKNKTVRSYFEKKNWYHPVANRTQDMVEQNYLNDYEKKNAKVLFPYRDSLR